MSFHNGRSNNYDQQNSTNSFTDISEASSYQGYGHFPSTERIVQHPARKLSWDFGYRVRNLKDTEIPVLVPNSGFHRVNGFVQNTSRPYLGGSRAGKDKSPSTSLVRKLSNPFRRSSPRRPRFSQVPYSKSQRSARYSIQLSDPDDQRPAKRRSLGGIAKIPVSPAPNLLVPETPKEQLTTAKSPTRDRADTVGSSAAEFTPNSDNTPSFHHFNLIPLSEAARRQAERRASGLDDETATGRARLQQGQSFVSSKATGMGSPVPSPLPMAPEPVFRPAGKRVTPQSPRSHLLNRLVRGNVDSLFTTCDVR